MPKPREFSQFEGPGRDYATKKKRSERREPRRDKQVARGVGFAQTAQRKATQARRAMGRGRVGEQYGKGKD